MVEFKYEQTKQYVKAVEDYLAKTHGEIKDCWKPLITMLGQQYDLFVLSKETIDSQGLITQGARGMQANPAIKINNDSLIQIQKLVQELGISPKIAIKLKTEDVKKEDGKEEDFIEKLING